MVFGKHINRYYIKYAAWLILGLVALLMVDMAQLKVPEFYRIVVNGINDGVVEIDGVTKTFDLYLLLDEVCKPLLIVILMMIVGRFAWRVCFFGVGIRVTTDLRRRMFDHAKDLSLQYYQVNKVGNLMSLFTNDLETVEEGFSWGILTACDAFVLGGMAIYKMYRMNPTLTLLSMIPMAFLLAGALILGKYMSKKWESRQEAFSSLSDFAQENFSGIAVIKAFVKETKELLAFRKLNRENENANVTYTKYSTMMHICVTLFLESVICVILGYGGYLAYNDLFNAGELVEFIGYFNSVIWPIMAISELIDMSSRGRASVKRISELLNAKQDVHDREGVEDVAIEGGEITFQNLSFAYPDGEVDALHDISFHIPKGAHVGIIGRTGCGKTTLVDLILRTYAVPDGTIFVDGHDVNDIPIRNVRAAAAYVPQDNFLFSDTIANNISFGVEETDYEEVRHAAVLSDVDDNIMQFTSGYDTILGERGVTVSGGQKQRISIARAMMKNAPILILDDSVSAVDTHTERIILDNLRESRDGRTTILIAHRVSTVQSMDLILFMEEGTLLDAGTHEELYNRCEAYHQMVELQRLEDEKKKEEENGNV